MTPLIHASDAILDEIEPELRAVSLDPHRLNLVANSAEAVQGAYHVLEVGIGASIALIAQAIVTYMQKRQGQRKIIVQTTDKSGNLHRVEVETPRADELEGLLQQARDIFITGTDDQTE